MIAATARVFRALNTQLLYRHGLVNLLLKFPYLLSVYGFKWWTKSRRESQTTVLANYDGDTRIRVDISRKMGASLFWTGFHEFNEMRYLHSHLRSDMVFVDVGANQGEYSLFAARRVGGGKVLAFEPMSFFYDQLTANVKMNRFSNIEAYKIGLSARQGTVPIYFDADNAQDHEGLASLFSASGGQGGTEMIELDTLDNIVAKDQVSRVDFIKIDVEGAEWDVLKGSERALRMHRPALMIELNDITAARAGYDVGDMIQWLEERGYRPHLIGKKGITPMQQRPAFGNAVFLAR